MPAYRSRVRGDRPPADGASQGSGAEVRAAAAGALFHFGPEAGPAVRPLLGILVNPDVSTQEAWLACVHAARTLAVIGGEARSKMYRLLLSRLNSLDGEVRQQTAILLNPFGNRHVAVLLGALADPKSPRGRPVPRS